MSAEPIPAGPVLTQPPDPHTKTPQLKAPAGAIDCHIHLFGPASRFPFNPGSRYICEDALPETAIALQDTLGLAGSVAGVTGRTPGTWRRCSRNTRSAFAAWPSCPTM